MIVWVYNLKRNDPLRVYRTLLNGSVSYRALHTGMKELTQGEFKRIMLLSGYFLGIIKDSEK